MEISTVYPFEKDIPDIRDLGSTRPFGTYNSSVSRLRPVRAIVAMGRDRAIGVDGDMPWHIREDLRRFKSLTMGHPVIMGRATWQSLPRRPLPGRLNVVLTRRDDYRAEGALVARSLEEAVAMCDPAEVPFVIGGGAVYREALPLLERIYVTLVDAEFPGADTFFPALSAEEWREVNREGPFATDEGLRYSFLELVRK